MGKTKLEKLTAVTSTATINELHGLGILFAGGYSARIEGAPNSKVESQRPDSDSLAVVIVALDSMGCTKKVKGDLLQDRLTENLRHFTVQANNALKRAKALKEKQEKAAKVKK